MVERKGDIMTKSKFIRRGNKRYSKLGLRRKSKQVWRRPTGRDNKLRERRKNRGVRVEVGYRTAEKDKKEIININNVKDLEKVKKDAIIVLGKVGRKNKMKIAKKAKEKKIEFNNLNINKFLKSSEKLAKAKAEKAEAEKAKTEKKAKKEIKEEAKAESKEIKSEEEKK